MLCIVLFFTVTVTAEVYTDVHTLSLHDALPIYALVSAGHGNRFGHPKPDGVARWRQAGARVQGTPDGGALRVRLEAGGVTVESRRQSHPRAWDAVQRQRRQACEGTGQAALVSCRPD